VTVSTGPEASVEPARETRIGHGVAVRAVLLHGDRPRERQSALRAALGAGVDARISFGPADGRAFAELAAALREARPDVVIAWPDPARRGEDLAPLVEALRLGCGALRPAPRLFVHGDARAAVRLAGAAAPLETASFASEPQLVGALRELRRGGDATWRLRDVEDERAARNIASLANADTLAVYVDGAVTSCVLARPDGSGASVHAALGVGAGADRVVARVGVDRVRRWLPWAIDAPALLERVFNRARWPEAVPASPAALALEMALAREAIGRALEDAAAAGLDQAAMRSARVIVLAGRLASFPRPAQGLLVAVDAVEPSAFTTVIRERAGTYETVAAVAPVWPRRTARLRFQHASGSGEQRVARGAFYLAPVRGRIELTTAGADLRGTAEAGALGMLIDARGRPVTLPLRDAERLPALARWHAAVAALPA